MLQRIEHEHAHARSKKKENLIKFFWKDKKTLGKVGHDRLFPQDFNFKR